MKDVTKCLKAVANERRLRILKELSGRRGLTVSVIARRIKLSVKSTSKHIQKLADCGLVKREQRSLEVWCSLDESDPLLRFLLPKL